ncbi:MAG: hypothetical protein ACI9YB_003499 [Halioglobus sp.]
MKIPYSHETQNPVAKMESPIIIKLDDFNQFTEEYMGGYMIRKDTINIIGNFCSYSPKERREVLAYFNAEVLPLINGKDAEEDLKKVVVKLETHVGALKAEGKRPLGLESLLSRYQHCLGRNKIQKMKEKMTTIVDQAEKSFSKDEMNSFLKVWEQGVNPDEEGWQLVVDKRQRSKIKSSISDAMRVLRDHPSSYISKDILEKALGYELSGSKGISNLRGFKNLAQWATFSDLEEVSKRLPPSRSAGSLLKVFRDCCEVIPLTENSYVFKLGSENPREILVGVIAKPLGLDSYLIKKREVKISNAQMKGVQSPKGIAGRWIEGESDFLRTTWTKFTRLKRDMLKTKFEFENKSRQGCLTEDSKKIYEKAIPKLEQEFELAVSQLRNHGGAESIQMHALLDLTTCSYDSHLGQYKEEDGDIYNFDFARFLMPSEGALVCGKVYSTLRSAFIDHPVADDPLNNSILEKIRSWDVDEIVRGYCGAGIKGDEEVFASSQDKVRSLNESIKKLQTPAFVIGCCKNPSELEGLIRSHGIVLDQSGEILEEAVFEVSKEVKKKLEEKRDGIIADRRREVHPQAFTALVDRLNKIKEYVADTDREGAEEAPTITGLLKKLYPELAVIIPVVARMEANPGQSHSSSGIGPKALEIFIERAKQEGLATPDELDKMRKAVASLEKRACSFKTSIFVYG